MRPSVFLYAFDFPLAVCAIINTLYHQLNAVTIRLGTLTPPHKSVVGNIGFSFR